MASHNKEIARSLRQRGHELPESSKTRYGLFIAAKNIENHPTPLTTDREAREVPRVGSTIVNILMELGLLRQHLFHHLPVDELLGQVAWKKPKIASRQNKNCKGLFTLNLGGAAKAQLLPDNKIG